jgi:hypothetical protein
LLAGTASTAPYMQQAGSGTVLVSRARPCALAPDTSTVAAAARCTTHRLPRALLPAPLPAAPQVRAREEKAVAEKTGLEQKLRLQQVELARAAAAVQGAEDKTRAELHEVGDGT